MQGIVLTASVEFRETAKEEIRLLLPGCKLTDLTGDVLWLDYEVQEGQAIRSLSERPPIFLRHLHEARIWCVNSEGELVETVAQALKADFSVVPSGASVAVQARSFRSPFTWQPRDLKAALDPLLAEQGLMPTIKAPEWVVSVTQVGHQVYYGLALARQNLSDWTGGMVHYRKGEEDVSRARFKLLEAIARFNLLLKRGSSALDLGAAPGGWTQELLSRGLRVLAVDTAPLDGRLSGHRDLRYLQANVKDLRLQREEQFDLITCDMSWDPLFTAHLLAGLMPNLRPGGQVVMTVKLPGREPLRLIERVVAALGPKISLEQGAHLWHNRREVTLHLRRLP